jgi:hypothetical protein
LIGGLHLLAAPGTKPAMNRNDTSTLRASPLSSFFQQKALCAGSLDPQSIIDQAGLVA